MINEIDYKQIVVVGAWTARYLFDETVNAIILRDFSHLRLFIDNFLDICQNFGGYGAALQLEKAAALLEINGQKHLASECLKLSKVIYNNPFAPSCLNLEMIQEFYKSEEIISQSLENICDLLKCSRHNLAINIDKKIKQERRDQDWTVNLPSLFIKNYQEWFIPFATKNLSKYLPQRTNFAVKPRLQVTNWSDNVWRCWRMLNNQPLLIDSGNIGAAQFFVWRLIHDSTHVWQMQAYGKKWSNFPSSEELVFLEAGAMCAEYVALELAKKNQLNIPSWYPSSTDAIILRLMLGQLEREIRLNYDISVHLHGQGVNDWTKYILRWTGVPRKLLGFATEFLGMPGFSAAYIVARDTLLSLEDAVREQALANCKLPGHSIPSQPLADNLSRVPQTDVPNFVPSIQVKLSHVGTNKSKVILWFEDPWQKELDFRTVGTATISVNLTDKLRGIHMSRLQEILAYVSNKKWSNIIDAAIYTAQEAVKRQEANLGKCTFNFNVIRPILSRHSRKLSSHPVDVTITAQTENNFVSTYFQVTVGVMTACPCTIQYSKLFAERKIRELILGEAAENVVQNLPPTFTHSQPGKVSLKLKNSNVSISQAVHWITAVTHPVEQVLKREDEHELVMRSHSRPMFCEDLVRNVAAFVAAQLPKNIFLAVSAELDESIHPHKVFAETEGYAETFWQSN